MSLTLCQQRSNCLTQMVVHKTFSRGGRVKITVEQPPTQPALQPDRLQAENENLR